MSATRYPRLWENKLSGQRVRVMPWWETVTESGIAEVDEMGRMISETIGGRPCKFGVITQIGFLIENEHGIWIGLGPKAPEGFIDLGEWNERRSGAI